MSNYKLINGNSLQVLKTFEENSIDSIVCDPPYELGFMGKSWDSTGIAFNKELWTECLRVLKPGGHLIAFSGSRTYHRVAVAIEDIGFEIRDQMMWVYGSGFPKGLDISKAIDKNNGRVGGKEKFTEWMRTTGLKASKLNKITNTFMGSHYLTAKQQPAIPTLKLWELIKPHITVEIPNYINEIVQRVEAEREVVGKSKSGISNKEEKDRYTIGASNLVEVDITIPSTPQAKHWQGWGTALKPAHEPMVLARKPLSEQTVADNVLKWGTGAINIDGCRVDYNGEKPNLGGRANHTRGEGYGFKAQEENAVANEKGRWPANFIHDGLNEEWSRYFYCPKASKKDRNEGLDGFELKGKVFNGQNSQATIDGYKVGSVEDKFTTSPSSNNHPTVKPTDLMAYLCRLVTPPNGTVLDPFNGSGSTGKAAIRENFNYVGIDLSQEYLDISKARIEYEISKKK